MSTLELKLVSEINNDDYIICNFGVSAVASGVRDHMRGVLTAPRDQKSMWVYRPQDTYAMGIIAYGNYQDNPDAQEQYCVFSPNISNGKYNYGDRKYVASATTSAKAIKNAAKYLRPLTTSQVMRQAQDRFVDAMYSTNTDTRQAVLAHTRPLNTDLFNTNPYRDVEQSPLHKELRRMIDAGYEFLDKQLGADLRAAFTAMDDYSEAKRMQRCNHVFVEVMKRDGMTMLRGFDDVDNNRNALNPGNGFVYSQHEVPEDIAGKIAVLSMAEVGQHVAGVGYRAAPNMFYLAKDECA